MKISDVFTPELIFSDDITTLFEELSKVESENPVYPKVSEFINTDNYLTLNEDYFVNHSADKFVSPFFKKLYNAFGSDPDTFAEKVAQVIYNRFGEKWKRIYDAIMTIYNPLENYSMEEVRTPDLSISETENEKTDINVDRETHATNSYKGFNANDPVVVNKTDGDEDVTTSGAKLDNEKSKSTSHTGTETLTRAGNIGVTTSQQMLESEFKVRQYDFYKMVYNDIDSVLCLSVY